MSNVRLVLRLLALASALLIALPLHAAWRIVRAPSPWPRRFLLTCAYVVGARPRVLGLPLARNAVLLANHLSWIDILLLAGTTGCTFVAKGELERVPLIGWLCGLNGTIFVARGDRMAVGAQVETLRGALAGARPVAIFPEGTTGDGVTLLPFKPALLAALDPPPSGLRVQPVRIDYGDATGALAWVGDEPGGSHAARVLRRRGAFTATLAFGEPFAPEGGRKAVAAEARAVVAALALPAIDAPLSDDELAQRRPVWEGLAESFLDTDFAGSLRWSAWTIAASPYPLTEIERILVDEVTPVVRRNLYSVAGEWTGFGADWLEPRIHAVRARGRPGRRMRMMWPDWLHLREAIVDARAGRLGGELECTPEGKLADPPGIG